MGTSLKYDQLVEGFRAKISGNISSVKMTPEETAKEIAEVTGGAVSSFQTEETHSALTGTISDESVNIGKPVEIKRKRGRPLGSKNKPKQGTP